MRSALVVLAMVGCNASDTTYPILPGGGMTVPGGGSADGGVIVIDGRDGGPAFAGRACLLLDLSDQVSCATTGAGGYLVTLDNHQTLTTDTGAFVIGTPLGTNLTWQIVPTTAATTLIKTSLMGLSAVPVIPVIATQSYTDFQTANGVTEPAGEGALFVRVVHAGLPVANVTGTTSPVSAYPTFYDAQSLVWNLDATGMHGVMWMPALPVGTVNLIVTPPASTTGIQIPGIPIGDNTLTFVTLEL